MRKFILYWLFGTDDIKDYMDLLGRGMEHTEEELRLIDEHLKTLEREKRVLVDLGKLIKICRNHGIDVDEEIKKIDGDDL